MIGLMSSTLKGPGHILRRTSNFTREMVESSLGGEVYTLSETADHILLLKDAFGPFEGMNPGAAGLEECESLLTRLKTVPGTSFAEHPTGLGGRRIGECVLASRHGVPR